MVVLVYGIGLPSPDRARNWGGIVSAQTCWMSRITDFILPPTGQARDWGRPAGENGS